jgi:hypothetical protein
MLPSVIHACANNDVIVNVFHAIEIAIATNTNTNTFRDDQCVDNGGTLVHKLNEPSSIIIQR